MSSASPHASRFFKFSHFNADCGVKSLDLPRTLWQLVEQPLHVIECVILCVQLVALVRFDRMVDAAFAGVMLRFSLFWHSFGFVGSN